MVANTIIFPLAYVASFGYYLLKLLVAPLVKLGLLVLHLALLPWRIFLKFEALFIYFGVALLTGVFLGLILYLTTTLTIDLLNHAWSGQSSHIKLRSKHRSRKPIKISKISKNVFRQSGPRAITSDWVGWDGRQDALLVKGGGLLSETILEEEEEELSQDSEEI